MATLRRNIKEFQAAKQRLEAELQQVNAALDLLFSLDRVGREQKTRAVKKGRGTIHRQRQRSRRAA